MRKLASALAFAAGLFAGQAFAADFTLKSEALAGGVTDRQVSNVFGCSGGNVSPDFAWEGAPEGTESFVLSAYDPDAPTGSGWWHWVVVDIPADAAALPEGASGDTAKLPDGAREMRGDSGAAAYLGPCPPPGPAHRYVFTLTALKVPKLGLPPEASAALVGFTTNANSLGKATLTVIYRR